MRGHLVAPSDGDVAMHHAVRADHGVITIGAVHSITNRRQRQPGVPAPSIAVGRTTAVGCTSGGAPRRSASGTTSSSRTVSPYRAATSSPEIDVQAVPRAKRDHARAQGPP